jgi:hypothetical protein
MTAQELRYTRIADTEVGIQYSIPVQSIVRKYRSLSNRSPSGRNFIDCGDSLRDIPRACLSLFDNNHPSPCAFAQTRCATCSGYSQALCSCIQTGCKLFQRLTKRWMISPAADRSASRCRIVSSNLARNTSSKKPIIWMYQCLSFNLLDKKPKSDDSSAVRCPSSTVMVRA